MVGPRALSDNESLTTRVCVWTGIELIPLALATTRVPLAARFPAEAEIWAPQEMIIIQILASALLFPWLLPSWRAALAIILSSVPMLWLAGLFAATPAARLLCASG